MLIQDDASKAILLDPSQLEKFSESKIKAYDELKKLLQEISNPGAPVRMEHLIKELQEIDESKLRPIDTQILETLFENPEEARKLYFEKYDPERLKYAKLVNELKEAGVNLVESESQSMASSNAASFQHIVLALALGIFGVILAIQILGKQIALAQLKIAKAFDELKNRTRTIETIYNNLASGFFLVDPQLKLQDGLRNPV
jgi:hypothetical protein